MDRQTTEQHTNLALFLAELTALSRKHGIALGEKPTLYVMEPEDHQFSYRADDEDRITLG
jgi:hypothetical protein